MEIKYICRCCKLEIKEEIKETEYEEDKNYYETSKGENALCKNCFIKLYRLLK